MNALALITMFTLCAIVFAILSDEAPPLPKNLQLYFVVANIDFAEGPIFDSRGNLYFVNYLRNGTIGKIARDGTSPFGASGPWASEK
jgi:hypothetical protein